jgi:hypothetical protein
MAGGNHDIPYRNTLHDISGGSSVNIDINAMLAV